MGIRIKKIIGYSIDSLKEDDERIDWKKLNTYYEKSPNVFYSWLMENKDSIKYPDGVFFNLLWWNEKSINEWRPFRSCIYDSEFGLPNVMMFVPPTQIDSWIRYDDIIDHYENESYQAKLMKLDNACGIFPYGGRMIRYRGQPVCGKDTDSCYTSGLMNGGLYNQFIGKWDKNIEAIAKGELLNDLIQNWRPQLPFELIAFIKWIDIDKEDFLINNIRPSIYTYWS